MLNTHPRGPVPPLQFAPLSGRVDRRGYLRSPITMPEYRLGRRPDNAGLTFPAEPLTPEEAFALVDACGDGAAARRNRALIVMYWRTGLRCQEALDLYPKDVDLYNGRVAVLHGKGDRRRVVAIDRAGAAIVGLWERERREIGLNGTQPYFCVLQGPTAGRGLGDAYVRDLFKKLGKRAGIEKRVHPHGLRHTYASYLLDRGVPIHHIRRMLGHGSLAVTERYADHLNPAAVLEEMLKVEWPTQAATLQRSQRLLTA